MPSSRWRSPRPGRLRRVEWNEREGVRWLEAELPHARAAFSTRLGGVSEPPFARLNLGLLTGDERSSVLANRRRLAAALGRDPAGFLVGHQVHAADVLRRAEPPQPNPYLDADARPPESDGQATAAVELTPLVQVADCLPVAIPGPGGVAMLHCGWRGLAAGLIAHGVAAVGAEAAAIGPGIGPCCYEVGAEVLGEFATLGPDVSRGPTLDLVEITRRLLAAAGVGDVDATRLCTSCERELFFSHRRDGARTGRQAGLVWSEPGG